MRPAPFFALSETGTLFSALFLVDVSLSLSPLQEGMGYAGLTARASFGGNRLSDPATRVRAIAATGQRLL